MSAGHDPSAERSCGVSSVVLLHLRWFETLGRASYWIYAVQGCHPASAVLRRCWGWHRVTVFLQTQCV